MIWVKSVLLVLAPAFLTLGIMLPLVRFETLYFFSDNPSLVEIVLSLWREGNSALAALVGLLSIVFPSVKLVGLMAEALGPAGGDKGRGLMHALVPLLSKWSMTDVLLVAIVIFAAKTSGLAEAFTQPGLWFYAASAVIAGLLHARPFGSGPR
ncbi:MAG: paraquat-inducible protein A [Allorhizobium sp.]